MTDLFREQLQQSLGVAYTITRELGGGGMSRVFVAHDTRLDRDVVVKVLSTELAAELSAERFAREIKLAAALQEPHIVPVISDGITATGLPYYTMPFVQGASLRERMHSGLVPIADALDILRDVAKALAHAHGRGIVHRDIKPDNILLSSGTAVVTDFGIAKAMELSRTQSPTSPVGRAITRTGTSLGTPAYMAPEQAAGDPDTDQRADIYAWGVVAYELLSGKHPFAGRTSPQQLMAAHFSETPTALSRPSSVIPAHVAAVVMRCLAKNPTDRPASAQELVSALDRATVSDVPATKSNVRARSVVVAVLLIASVGIGAIWQRYSGGPKTNDGLTNSAPVMMAVLPFEHHGPPDQEPFTDGLTDAVTSKLAGLKSLAVIDRRSAATYKGTTKPAKQIGTELGVKFLLQGVVRWAKDGAGIWKARVTPTLIDAQTGVIKWTGDAQDVTLDDPFTAQGTIATDVAQKMEVAVLPEERAGLLRSGTNNPQALAAFQRGRSIIDLADRTASSQDPLVHERAAMEFERAVQLDSNFVEAWAKIADERLGAAILVSFEPSRTLKARKSIRDAVEHSGELPLTKLILAGSRFSIDRDTIGVDQLVNEAIARAPNDVSILTRAAGILVQSLGQSDKAFQLLQRATRLDPREAGTLALASVVAREARRFSEASHLANSLIALDSTDERGWLSLVTNSIRQGDSAGTRQVINAAKASLGKLSGLLTWELPYAGTQYAREFLRLSARELNVVTLYDSVNSYYDGKSDAALNLRDEKLSRIYCDSILNIAHSFQADAQVDVQVLEIIAFARANSLDTLNARRDLEKLLKTAGAVTSLEIPVTQLRATGIAAIYARLGDPETAVRWLEQGSAIGAIGYSAQGFAHHPKLQVLRGNPAFEAFLRRHP